MFLYKVTHKYKLNDHIEKKQIGIYSSEKNALDAITILKQKSGFCDTQDEFKIKKVFRILKPKLINKTFWVDGFITYTY